MLASRKFTVFYITVFSLNGIMLGLLYNVGLLVLLPAAIFVLGLYVIRAKAARSLLVWAGLLACAVSLILRHFSLDNDQLKIGGLVAALVAVFFLVTLSYCVSVLNSKQDEMD